MARCDSHLTHPLLQRGVSGLSLMNDERRRLSMQTECAAVELGLSVVARIGETPLIRLGKAVRGLEGVVLLAKAEWLNPGGSVKDRAAWAMVRKAQAEGKLGPGKTLLDATSGNTGIALAMLGAALGFPVLLTIPSNVSPERKREIG